MDAVPAHGEGRACDSVLSLAVPLLNYTSEAREPLRIPCVAFLATQPAPALPPARISYGSRGRAPAASARSHEGLYEFVRLDLAIPIHGRENLELFGKREGAEEFAPGESEETVGGAVSRIYEAIRDGRMQTVVVGMFDGAEKSAA